MTLKRLVAPEWPIERKTKKFVVKPRPGPHSSRHCMPLALIIRDVLGYARDMKEARMILNNGQVKVDGIVRKERGFPVGLMDVVSLGEEHYRMLIGKHGLEMRKIKHGEAGVKLLRVNNKSQLPGKLQINFHDGSNLNSNAQVKTGDVVVMELGKNTIRDTIRMEKGATVLITGGHNRGLIGKIVDILITRSPMPNQITISLGDREIRLPKDYIFAVGRNEPVISMGEKL